MIRRLLAVAVACAGCSAPDLPVEFPFNMWVDPMFDMRDQCLFDDSVKRWHDATSGIAEVGVVYGWFNPEHYVKRADESDAHRSEAAAFGQNDVHPGGQTIYLWPERVAHWVEWARTQERYAHVTYSNVMLHVMQHELGHHFGLTHTDERVLMHESCVDPGCMCITQHDLNAFCAIYGCSLIAPPCAPPPACE